MAEVESSPNSLQMTPPEPNYSPLSQDETHNNLNLITGPNEPEFHIQLKNNKFNNVLTSLVNSLRRTIITDVKTISFDIESLSGFDNPNLNMIENKSKYHNDYLAHRLV